jgi:phytoene dehydrogenase-like protein
MATASDFDVIIIGAGHNGLTCAGYLARAGLRVKVVERRHVVGGAAVTEEFHPGFRNSTCSYTVSLLNPKVIRDLELNRYGLEIRTRAYSSFVLGANNTYIHLSNDKPRSLDILRRHCAEDAERYPGFERVIEQVADVMRDVVLETPPNIGGGLPDLWRAGKLAWRVQRLTPELQAETARLFTMSIADYLARWFAGDILLGLESYTAMVGNLQSAYAPGSAYVLLHHMFGEVNGMKGHWGHATGGMGAITQAMARSAQAHGADIEVSAPVKQVIVENGHARGVELMDGRVLRGRALAANVNPKLLFLKLVDRRHLPPAFVHHMGHYRCRSGSFRMNVALSELPRFSCIANEPDYEDFLKGSIILAPSLAYNERAYEDAMKLGWSREPIIEMFLPSVYDDTLAPPGKHVMSLFCQHFNPELPDGKSWDDVREQVADHIIGVVNNYAPNFRAAVVGRMALSPLDLEQEFGLVGGDIFHGCLHLDQIYSMRPAPGYADYRTPVAGLYLCGSGAHPGGGVSGCPGHNAAREMLADRSGWPV